MDSLAFALILIFCTPFGWIGLLIVGAAVAGIIEATRQ
jgi:hypothetical protein